MSDGAATAPLRTALAAALPERPFTVELWDGTALPATNGSGAHVQARLARRARAHAAGAGPARRSGAHT